MRPMASPTGLEDLLDTPILLDNNTGRPTTASECIWYERLQLFSSCLEPSVVGAGDGALVGAGVGAMVGAAQAVIGQVAVAGNG